MSIPEQVVSHLAMFLLGRLPILAPLEGSSLFSVTRSIFDIMLIQGISRLTIADMADKTPLHITQLCQRTEEQRCPELPEELVSVLHELGVDKIDGARAYAHLRQVPHKRP
jgi:hypothetical protein